MRVLVCPDKFKGTLTAPVAAQAMASGWHQVRPDDVVECLPISDGGDGFGELLGRHLAAEAMRLETMDAAHRPIQATWWWVSQSRLAIIESANVIGLAMLPTGRFYPFELDTFGLGAVLRAAARQGAQKGLIGIGGSATNDAGFGLARGLGWEFCDQADRRLECWTELDRLVRVVPPSKPLHIPELVVAVDVRNRLLGQHGATRVYGPQKGMRPEDFPRAEGCLRRLVRVLNRTPACRANVSRQAGSGAAGGLGFGLACFAGARLESGFDLFARQVGLMDRIRAADWVITGEGAIDETTVRAGKGVGQIASACRRSRRPCLGLAGLAQIGDDAKPFTRVWGIAPALTTAEQAKQHAEHWLRELARMAASQWGQPAHESGR